MQLSTKYPRKKKMIGVTNLNFTECFIPQSQNLCHAIETMTIVAGANGINLSKNNDFKRAKFLTEQAAIKN